MGEYTETYLQPLSREEEKDLAERMRYKRQELFDMITSSQPAIDAVYKAVLEERERRGLKAKIILEQPPKEEKAEGKKRKGFSLTILTCLLETAIECQTTTNRTAVGTYLGSHVAKAFEFFEGLREQQETAPAYTAYLRLHGKLVEHNRLLVKSISKTPRKELDYYGRIEAGERGLITAAHEFDADTGNKFSTYATIWIKQAIGRESKTSKVVAIPIYAQYEKKGRWLPKGTSLDYARTEDRGLLNFLEDKKAKNPLEEAARTVLESDVARILTRISEREAQILRMRFGLDGNDTRTLKEIGDKIGVSRERVRQIEWEALRKLSRRVKIFAEAV